jgi:hypothetical protein
MEGTPLHPGRVVQARPSRMKHLRLTLPLWLAGALLASAGSGAPSRVCPTLMIPAFELRDQFNQPQALTFPATNVQIVIVADRKGSEQIEGWVRPLKQHYGERLVIHGVADVRSVPALLRGRVRREFQQAQMYPVMLDWSGQVVKNFSPTPQQANLCLLNREGRIVARFSGSASPAQLQQLQVLLDSLLAGDIPAATDGSTASSVFTGKAAPAPQTAQ